jgi:hypothetical protein
VSTKKIFVPAKMSHRVSVAGMLQSRLDYLTSIKFNCSSREDIYFHQESGNSLLFPTLPFQNFDASDFVCRLNHLLSEALFSQIEALNKALSETMLGRFSVSDSEQVSFLDENLDRKITQIYYKLTITNNILN